jgi:hypothetical protein
VYRFAVRLNESGEAFRAEFSTRADTVVTSAATLRVLPASRPRLFGPKTARFRVGKRGSLVFTLRGSAARASYSGTLPTGVRIVSSGALVIVSGVPTAGTEGTYHITLRAGNSAGSGFASLVLYVSSARAATRTHRHSTARAQARSHR